jgi:hypothetical protein
MTCDYGHQVVIRSTVGITISQTVMAMEVRHILFDVFGQHLGNLANKEAQDFGAGTATLDGTWKLYDDNAARLLTTVTYVARVRLADGTQWVVNRDNLTAALETLHLEKKIENELPLKNDP